MANSTQEVDYKEIDFRLLKRLMKYLKPYKGLIVLAIVLTVFVSAIGPLRPYLTKLAIDDFIARKNETGLFWFVFLIFGVMVFHALLQFSLTFLMQWVGQKVLNDIRIKLFDHIQNLSMKFYDNNPIGRLVTRVTNDVEGLNEIFSSGVVMIIADLMLVFWIIAFMFYTNWKLTLFTLSILPFLFIATTIFRKKVRELFRKIRLSVSAINSFLNEFFSGITTIKLFSQEEKQHDIFANLNKENRSLWVKSVLYYASFFPVVEMLSSIALSLILWYTAGNILSGVMTIGTLVAFLQFSEMFFRPIRDLTEKYTTMQSAMAASERIFGLLDTESFIEDVPGSSELKSIEKSIEFKNVSFSYDDSKQVLKDISFEVKKGETVAIVGATGAGKTSIINLLCRFYDFASGDILIDGKSIKNIRQQSLRDKIALVMQDVFLFSRTISDNITLGNQEISESEVKKAAEALGISTFIESLPDTFKTKVTERGSTLSSGQRQLISFARAFASNPELLVLDEATSNIDSETEKIIENSLERLLSNRTSIVIAHRLSTIKRADKIVVLHHGYVREVGNHSELLEKKGLYARLYQLQFNKN